MSHNSERTNCVCGRILSGIVWVKIVKVSEHFAVSLLSKQRVLVVG